MSEKRQSLVLLAIFSFGFLAMGIGTITPAIATIGGAFPAISFSTLLLVSTIPALVSIPVSILGGSVAGKSVKYRTLALFATLVFSIAGAIPYYLQDFNQILLARGLFGLGLGLIMPLNSALIFNLVPEDKQASVMGINSVVMNIGGIVLQLLGGVLASIGWNYSFLAHALGIITFIIVLVFLPEPQKQEIPAGTDGVAKEKLKMPGSVFGWSLLFGIVTILDYPSLTNMSSVLLTIKANAAVAGVVLMFMTVGGMAAGAIFGNVYQKFGRQTLSIGLVFFIVSQVIFSFSQSVTLFIIGEACLGVGLTLSMSSIYMLAGASVHPSQTPMAMSIIVSGMNLGGFLSGYFYAAIMEPLHITTLRFQYYFGTGGYLAILVFFLILFAVKKPLPLEAGRQTPAQ
ncbi:MFS transporter [Desulfosporosinus meridiei]|uniref:Arabinose efflux permease family protein n=1 Tax=Desulfosporosinus meridiei (strain ATCC BAA-275 / DSM 13257 / KCTC 12902 / NCIMB 13706 / S10) TaxID=768704 RepID=J7IXC1_DESMD|nr:MFS transporter [Desulfosporosinus meridiei]AFQ43346.1 arabinose efflux permease family protein [Desulfosporosinus meridiei DSM 13257]